MYLAKTTSAAAVPIGLGAVAADFAGQIATAVWLGKLSDDAGREALWCFALARHRGARHETDRLCEALLDEYGRRRARQDACC